jgi:hypothetical protein
VLSGALLRSAFYALCGLRFIPMELVCDATPIIRGNPKTVELISESLDIAKMTPWELEDCILLINEIHFIQGNMEQTLAGNWHPHRGTRKLKEDPFEVDMDFVARLEGALCENLARWEKRQTRFGK